MTKLEIGMILDYPTCDGFDPITGKGTNNHIEKVLIEDIKNDTYYLYNYDTKKRSKVSDYLMRAYIRCRIYEISEERGE